MKVQCSPQHYDPSLWVANNNEIQGVSIVEGPLKNIVAFDDTAGVYTGQVFIASHDEHVKLVGESQIPWTLRIATDDDRRLAEASSTQSLLLSRSEFRWSSDVEGQLLSADGERVYTIKLTDKCPHESENYEVMGCGHAKCAMCNCKVCYV